VTAGEIFAVKEIVRAGGRDNVDELMREVNTMSKLKHKYIVQYLGAALTDEHLYVFLEYVPGTRPQPCSPRLHLPLLLLLLLLLLMLLLLQLSPMYALTHQLSSAPACFPVCVCSSQAGRCTACFASSASWTRRSLWCTHNKFWRAFDTFTEDTSCTETSKVRNVAAPSHLTESSQYSIVSQTVGRPSHSVAASIAADARLPRSLFNFARANAVGCALVCRRCKHPDHEHWCRQVGRLWLQQSHGDSQNADRHLHGRQLQANQRHRAVHGA
jgi:hypothetical protein